VKPFDHAGAFRLPAEGDGLRSLAVRGAGMTVLSQGVVTAAQMAATVVLARLLTPGDFGLVAMVTTFSLLLMNLGFNGFTEAVIQRPRMDHHLASNLFWINIGLGVAATAAFAGAGSALARFYGDPRVASVAAALSATIFLSSASVLHLALLKRGLRFSAVSVNDVVARSASVIVSIVLGWAGWGYWSLVAGAIMLPLATTVGALILCRWVPGRPRRGAGTRPVVRFALNIYGRFAANYLTCNLDNLLIGWRFGPVPLGLYKKAYDLFLLPPNLLSSPLTPVAVSALSRVAADSRQHQRYFLSALSTIAFIGMGLGAALTLIGTDLMLLLLGDGWRESARIFTFFAPGVGAVLVYGTHGWIHLSIGRADRWLRWGLVEMITTASLFLLALRWGPVGMAVAWVASYWLLMLPGLWYALKPVQLGMGAVIDVVWRHVLASILAGGITSVIIARISWLSDLPGYMGAVDRMAVTSISFGAAYLGAVILLHEGIGPIRRTIGLLRTMIDRNQRRPGVENAALM
jgi:polysaccharide transporter, PST family